MSNQLRPTYKAGKLGSEIVSGVGGITFAGPDAVAIYRAIALKSGLAMYARCGMKPNRAWTPTAMLKAAGGLTGKTYRRGQYQLAADDLVVWIIAAREAISERNVGADDWRD